VRALAPVYQSPWAATLPVAVQAHMQPGPASPLPLLCVPTFWPTSLAEDSPLRHAGESGFYGGRACSPDDRTRRYRRARNAAAKGPRRLTCSSGLQRPVAGQVASLARDWGRRGKLARPERGVHMAVKESKGRPRVVVGSRVACGNCGESTIRWVG